MMNNWGSNNGWWNGGMVVMGVFWLVLIALGVWAVMRLTRHTGSNAAATVVSGGADSARHILDRRFASGEIDAQIYAEHRRVLEGRSVDGGPAAPGTAGGGVDVTKLH